MPNPKSPSDRSSDDARVVSIDAYRDKRDAGLNAAIARHPAYKAKMAREQKKEE